MPCDTYFLYHLHSDYSLLDSATKFQEYADLVKRDGGKAIASTEHGLPRGWVSKKMYCDKIGLKFVHGVEIYLTRDLSEKVRDNYHTVLLAKNEDGVHELNELVTLSSQPDHFYYTNRLTFDEFINISDNIIKTSACLAGPLSRLDMDDPYFLRLLKCYDFLEIQAHSHPRQVALNQKLLALAMEFGIPLVAGTDTHSSSAYKAECRNMILAGKGQSYGDEDSFDLTYKTFPELVEMFRAQNAIPEEEYMKAIENSNWIADECESFSLDTSVKYPLLYGSSETDHEKYEERVWESYKEKVADGTIAEEHREKYVDALKEELRVFKKLNMGGFMLTMSDLIRWCRANDLWVGPGRGSVCGSRAAYVTDITQVDPEVWGTVFSRFANEDRVEPPDVDTDVITEDRPKIFEYIIKRFGADKCARVASYGTLVEKSIIDLVCRVLAKQKDSERYSLANTAKIKKDYDADPESIKEQYPEIFYYFEGLQNCIISQSIHPAGMVISPITLADNYGLFYKDGDMCLLVDMDEAHDIGLVKYDFLGLNTVKVIRDTYRSIGKPMPRMHEINWEDEDVWNDMARTALTLFQMESDFAYTCMKRFKPKSIFDLCLITASIRPSGASYRNDLMARKPHKNPSPLLDELLKDNLGYLVYQEDVLRFLQDGCGLPGSFADTVRRGIAKKNKQMLDAAMPQILDGYCKRSDRPRKEAEQEAKEFIKVLEDSASYMFNKSHAIAYSMMTYLCGYLRYYHPIEYITSHLNNAKNEGDIINGTELMKFYGIKLSNPKFGESGAGYFYNKETMTIYKGVASIKFVGEFAADDLYRLSKEKRYTRFLDLLIDIATKTSANSRVVDLLIKIDYFSEFGNQAELLRLVEFANILKFGKAKQVSREMVDGTPLEPIFQKYANGKKKDGSEAKSYRITDMRMLMIEIEELVKSIGFKDLDETAKIRNYIEIMGYAGFMTGKEEDRPKLYVTDVKPLKRRDDGTRFGYNISTRSLGSGIESQFTIMDDVYAENPVHKYDLIYCKRYSRDRQYFRMESYQKIS